eukprot:Hpha_TRINITY_DN19210_c0_g1::TRINITY_DN19210_c0_g1_i1::g.194224::m.194224
MSLFSGEITWLRVPLAAFPVALGLYPLAMGKWSTFQWHPVLMSAGFISLGGNALITKKQGGKSNTKLHAYLMQAAAIAELAGLYVIYSLKDKWGKPHFGSTHGKIGAFVTSGCAIGAIAQYIMLEPDFGVAKGNKNMRTLHRYVGRMLTTLSYIAAYLGFHQSYKNVYARVAFGGSLFAIAPYLLL